MDSRPWSPWRIAGWSAGAVLLLLPLVAMQFTDEVKWDLADFMFAGALVAVVGVSYELAVRKTNVMFHGVLVVCILGALIARLRAPGMAHGRSSRPRSRRWLFRKAAREAT